MLPAGEPTRAEQAAELGGSRTESPAAAERLRAPAAQPRAESSPSRLLHTDHTLYAMHNGGARRGSSRAPTGNGVTVPLRSMQAPPLSRLLACFLPSSRSPLAARSRRRCCGLQTQTPAREGRKRVISPGRSTALRPTRSEGPAAPASLRAPSSPLPGPEGQARPPAAALTQAVRERPSRSARPAPRRPGHGSSLRGGGKPEQPHGEGKDPAGQHHQRGLLRGHKARTGPSGSARSPQSPVRPRGGAAGTAPERQERGSVSGRGEGHGPPCAERLQITESVRLEKTPEVIEF